MKKNPSEETHGIAIGRKPTQENVKQALEAARDSAQAAANASEVVLASMEGEAPAPTSQQPAPLAFDAFMLALQDQLKQAGTALSVSENAGWVKIENAKSGHKLYIGKNKTVVSRIESTLSPELVTGAVAPERHIGKIASVIPPTVSSVNEALVVLAALDEHVRPPLPRQPRTGK